MEKQLTQGTLAGRHRYATRWAITEHRYMSEQFVLDLYIRDIHDEFSE